MTILKKILFFLPLLALGRDLHAQTTLPAAADSVRPLIKNTVQAKGIITEALSGKPLSGVRVTYKNLSAAITDSTGGFSIKLPHYHATVKMGDGRLPAKEDSLKRRGTLK